MGSCEVLMNGDVIPCNGLNILRQYKPNKPLPPPPPPPPSSSWFDLRVFYVRITNLQVTDSTPQSLTVNHIPSDPELTHLEVNGRRCEEGIAASSTLRRDRIDKTSEEVTFVGTDSVRFTAGRSVIRFEVFDGEDLVLSGALENNAIIKANELLREDSGMWSLKCEAVEKRSSASSNGFLKGPKSGGRAPTVEVYVAGCFCGEPIILSRTVKIRSPRKKQQQHKHKHSKVKLLLDPIPEYEAGGCDLQEQSNNDHHLPSPPIDLQLPSHHKTEEYNYNNEELDHLYWGRTSSTSGGRYLADLEEEDDQELSLFNAGIRVGVGISLGICLGVGVGVGLLASTYQKTARNFRRRLF